jgi:flagellar motor protein MotB
VSPAAIPPRATRRARWALSFADLCLLLLAFFVMLQAGQKSRDALVSGVGDYFGARPREGRVDIAAATLFEPGEALLTPAGSARIAGIARANRNGLAVVSTGLDRTGNRFDGWDLAAARIGAVARALQAGGVAGGRLKIRGLDEAAGAGKGGQVIGFIPTRVTQ